MVSFSARRGGVLVGVSSSKNWALRCKAVLACETGLRSGERDAIAWKSVTPSGERA